MVGPGESNSLQAADQLTGRVLADRYELRKQLGKGGMAVVYEAFDRSFERVVAVKILRADVAQDPTAAKRLVREARAAGQLHHPNIIMMHDAGESDGLVYIVMEVMKGRELAELMEEEGAIGVRRSLLIGRQVASALSVAHAHGIIHRDIKPENLFLLEHDREGDFVKMLDFSIAKLPTAMVTAALTRAGSVFGTPHYMAPEQVEGRKVSAQTDIYALGAVLYELIAGEPPFDGDSVIDILLQHAKQPAPKLAAIPGLKLPDGLSDLVDSMLAKKESDRPVSAEAVEIALERLSAAVEPVAVVAPRDEEDKPTVAMPALDLSNLVALGLAGGPQEDGPPPAAPPPSAPAPRIIHAPARSKPRPVSSAAAPRPESKRSPQAPQRSPAASRSKSSKISKVAPADRSAPRSQPAPASPSPAVVDSVPFDLSLPSEFSSRSKKGAGGIASKEDNANTLLGHGLAEQVRAAAAEADREAARRASSSSHVKISAVPPPPGHRASLPSVSAPGGRAAEPRGERSHPRASGASRASGAVVSGQGGSAPRGTARVGADKDVRSTVPELGNDDVRRAGRASQETVVVSPSEMRDLSQHIRRSGNKNNKLLWVAISAGVLGVFGVAITLFLWMGGS